MGRSKIKFIFSLLGLAAILAFFAMPVFAQTRPALDLGLDPVGENIALGGGDIRVTIARILNIAFGLLGIVMVGIIIYAGFLYMTSGGDPKKTATAKKWIANAVIGLLIILSAFAITSFVLSRLNEATTGTTSGTSGTGGGGGGIGGSGSIFRIQSITPNGDRAPTGWPRNSTVKAVFNVNVDAATAAQNITVTRVTGGESGVSGAVGVLGSTLEFTPATACPAPNADRKCFDADAEFRVNILSGLKSADGRTVYCGLGSGCTVTFKIGNYIDTAAPSVLMISPISGGFVPQSVFSMSAQATDDTGISKVDFFVDNSPAGTVAGGGERTFNAIKDFDAASFAIGSSHQIKAAAYDVDSNLTVSSAVTVTVRAAHCFNGRKDFDETNIDCGGADCGVCSGASCTSGSQCSSGVCQNGVCVSAPVITGMSPADGAPGNLVTIYGRNFGNAPGTVTLSGLTALSGCANAWSNDQIIIVVPTGATTGKVKVTNQSNLSGESAADFVVNNITRPGICTITPSSGQAGSSYTISGKGFGGVQDSVLFDTRLATINTWGGDNIVGLVPTLTDGRYVVTVKVGSQQSNGIYFNITAPAGGTPSIRSVSPDSGPRGEYITIFGSNFGAATGKVTFLKGTAAADADISFPEGCGLDYWQDDMIIVKVPSGMNDTTAVTPGSYEIQVARADARVSNRVAFTVNDKTPKPGICKIDPDNGPPGKRVTLIGERFGDVAVGKVKFWQNKDVAGTSGNWSSTAAAVKVPTGATTGPLSLVSDQTLSNALNFKVSDCGRDQSICTTEEQCCAGSCIAKGESCATGPVGSYLWRFATGPIVVVPRVLENQDCSQGLIQSPNPWKGSTDACTNAILSAEFNVSMNTAVPAGAVKVEDCTGQGGAFDAGECAAHPVAIGSVTWGTSSQNEDDTINIKTDNLIANHAYQVTLVKTLRSAKNVAMDMDYVWRFRTSATGGCTISRVNVAPKSTTITEATENKDFTAYPVAANCNTLKCSEDFNFTWRTSDTRAEAKDARVTGDNLCKATAYPLRETGDTPVGVIALSATYNKEGKGDLFIKYTPPRIIDFWPSSRCPAACDNVDVGGEFNVEMDEATVENPDNIKIYECPEPASSTSTPTCAFAGGIPAGAERAGAVTYSSTAEHKTFSIDANLEKGKRYLVRVNGFEVKSVSGAPLSGLNPAPYFSWQFAVNDNAATCAVDRVELSPVEASLKAIFSQTKFASTPYGKPDACNATGPRLKGSAYEWIWGSSKTEVGAVLDDVATSTNRSVEARGPGSSEITAQALQSNPPGPKTSPPSTLTVSCACNANADCQSSDILNSYTPALTAEQIGCSLPASGGNQCCYPRPKVVSVLPLRDRTGVCRNAMIEAIFDQIMSTSTGKGLIEECAGPGSDCVEAKTDGDLKIFVQNGGTVVQFYPKEAFKKGQWYRVTLFGGEAEGWKNIHGVAMAQNESWNWKTGDGLCVLDKVEMSPDYHLFQRAVNDPNDDAIGDNYDKINDADKVFSVNYISTAGGNQQVVPIPGVYEWNTDWVANDASIILARDAQNRAIPPAVNASSVLGIAQNKNGTASIVATVTVSGSAVTTSSPRTLSAAAKIDVLLCENIWPANPVDVNPPGLRDDSFAFRSYYCRDLTSSKVSLFKPSTILAWLSSIYKSAVAQVSGTTRGEQILGVLPALEVVKVPSTPEPDILTEYLLKNPENRDAIGIRILSNPKHLSPTRWYYEVKNFKGSPKPIKLDGYEAIQDGRTVYAAAANLDGGGQVFTNIYLISYNEGASAETINIFNQLLANFKLNDNLDDKKVCTDGKTVCKSDLDCTPSVCEDAKSEVMGRCSTDNTLSCRTSVGCPSSVCRDYVPAVTGRCNTNNTVSCTSADNCPASSCLATTEILGTCSTFTFLSCRTAADCPPATGTYSSPSFSSPQGVAYYDNSRGLQMMWVSNFGNGTITSIGAYGENLGKVTASISVGSGPRALVTDESSVWVANYNDGTVTKLGVSDGIRTTLRVGSQPAALARDSRTGGNLWVANQGSDTVTKINAATGASKEIAVGRGPWSLAVGYGEIWVGNYTSKTLTVINTESDVATEIPTSERPENYVAPGAMGFHNGYLWVAGYDNGVLYKIQTNPLELVGAYGGRIGQYAKGIFFGGGYVWVTNDMQGTISQIDEATGAQVMVHRVGSGPWGLDGDGVNVWVGNSGDNTVSRLSVRALSCDGYSSGPKTCSGSSTSCNSDSDCTGVAKTCGGVAERLGTCTGTGANCRLNADCLASVECQGYAAGSGGHCSVGGAACTSDSECRTATSVCQADKSKITRDTKRLSDLKDIVDALDAYKTKNGKYPLLESGTFIRSLATSKWASWQSVLGGPLGAQELAVDPLNQFRDCTREGVGSVDAAFAGGGFLPISSGSTIYYSNGNGTATYAFNIAPNAAGVYRANLNTQNRGLDLSDKKYSDLQPSAFCAGNGVYHHLRVSVDGSYKGALCNLAGGRAQIGTLTLGYLGAGAHRVDISWDNDWYPNFAGVCGADKKCTLKKDVACVTNVDCDRYEYHYDSNLQINNVNISPVPLDRNTCWSEADKNFVCTAGSHVYQYRNIGGSDYALMSDFEYVSGRVSSHLPGAYFWAGEDVPATVQMSNTCNNISYGGSALCGDGVVGTGEDCELGQTQMTACSASGRSGVQKFECYKDAQNNCKWRNAGQCEVGRCGDGVTQVPAEVCDDGAQNGKYGYCAVNCSGFAARCGDGFVNASNGERCDGDGDGHDGELNGQYGKCAWDCSGPGPRCGDGVKQEGEICDGNVETSATEILGSCSNVTRSCRLNADCTVNEIMGACSAGKTGADCRANSDCNQLEVRGTCSNNSATSCTLATAATDCVVYDPTWAAGINKEDNYPVSGAGSIIGLSASGGVIRGTDVQNNLVWSGTLGNFLNAGAFPSPVNVAVGNGYGAAISAAPSPAPHLVIVPFNGTTFDIPNTKTYNIDNGAILVDIVYTPASFGLGPYFWATNPAGNKVYKINATNGSTMTITLAGVAPFGITFDGTSIWTANPAQNSISKINTSGQLLGTYSLGTSYNPFDLTYDSINGKLWASDNKNSKIYRIDPVSQAISSERSISNNGNPPVSVAFDVNSGLWVSYGNPLAGTPPGSAPIVSATVTRLWSQTIGTCSGYSAPVSGICDGYKPEETGTCNNYSSACAPQGGRAYLRDRTCSNSCTWGSWSVCKPVGSCGNGRVEAGEECDNGTLDAGSNCVFCKKARCGDGYMQKGVEQCDSGVQNGVPCNTMYGGTCNYCNSTCKLTTRTGPYCGNGTADVTYGEQCDGQDFTGAVCESYGFAENSAQIKYIAPEGRLQCTISCAMDVKKCKTCAEVSRNGKGDGFLSGHVKLNDSYINGAVVDLLGQDNEIIKSYTTGPDSQDVEGAFRFNNVATSTNCSYRIRVTYTTSDVDQVTYSGTSGSLTFSDVTYNAVNNSNFKVIELWLGHDAVTVCGDSRKDTAEDCDNGNIMERSGACVNCKNARCGDGYIRTGVEVCDFGSQNGQPDACDLSNNYCINKDYTRCQSNLDCSCNISCTGP